MGKNYGSGDTFPKTESYLPHCVTLSKVAQLLCVSVQSSEKMAIYLSIYHYHHIINLYITDYRKDKEVMYAKCL